MAQSRLVVGLSAVCALALAASGCPEDAESTAPYLIVGPSSRQPASNGAGVIVALQQAGGSRLRMRVEQGTLSFTGDSESSKASVACVAAPLENEPFYFNIIPKDAEAVLYVDLLAEGAIGVPDGGASLDSTCPGAPLMNKVVPIARPPANKPDAGDADAGKDGGA